MRALSSYLTVPLNAGQDEGGPVLCGVLYNTYQRIGGRGSQGSGNGWRARLWWEN